jgi:hypothetical protein
MLNNSLLLWLEVSSCLARVPAVELVETPVVTCGDFDTSTGSVESTSTGSVESTSTGSVESWLNHRVHSFVRTFFSSSFNRGS